jgi:hypothetical protein
MTTIITRIAGPFEGAGGDSVYELDNGQVWKQYRYFYRYKYSYRPRVRIETHGYRGTMHVEASRDLLTWRGYAEEICVTD